MLWSPVSWPLRQPGAHFVMFVGGVVVDNQMNLEERSVRGESLDPSPYLLSRSFNRFFFTCSLGLLAPPSSHDSTFPTLMVCSSSGAFTRILNGVADPKVISAKAPRRNAAMASIAASYRLSAGTRMECSIPSESTNETRHERTVGTV